MESMVLDGLSYNAYIKEADFQDYLERLSQIDSESTEEEDSD
jgi:hypothetical protein